MKLANQNSDLSKIDKSFIGGKVKFIAILTILLGFHQVNADSFTTVQNGVTYLCQSISAPTCAPNCISRNSSGICQMYSTDFCGPDANCSPHCISRAAGGDCQMYTNDFCGSFANCSEHCVSRGSNGICQMYTSDNCGTNANCSPNCISRGPSGQCQMYAADICN